MFMTEIGPATPIAVSCGEKALVENGLTDFTVICAKSRSQSQNRNVKVQCSLRENFSITMRCCEKKKVKKKEKTNKLHIYGKCANKCFPFSLLFPLISFSIHPYVSLPVLKVFYAISTWDWFRRKYESNSTQKKNPESTIK